MRTRSADLCTYEAISRGREFVTPDATFVDARSGQFKDVYQNERLGPQPGDEDRLVWAIDYQATYTICPPDGSPCFPPRPGVTTVILDFNTGAWITTFRYSPPSM